MAVTPLTPRRSVKAAPITVPKTKDLLAVADAVERYDDHRRYVDHLHSDAETRSVFLTAEPRMFLDEQGRQLAIRAVHLIESVSEEHTVPTPLRRSLDLFSSLTCPEYLYSLDYSRTAVEQAAIDVIDNARGLLAAAA